MRNIRIKNDSGGIWEEGKGNVIVMSVIFLSMNLSADSPVMTETARRAERGVDPHHLQIDLYSRQVSEALRLLLLKKSAGCII